MTTEKRAKSVTADDIQSWFKKAENAGDQAGNFWAFEDELVCLRDAALCSLEIPALRQQVAEMRRVGNLLDQAVFRLSQAERSEMTWQDLQTLRELRVAWDALQHAASK